MSSWRKGENNHVVGKSSRLYSIIFDETGDTADLQLTRRHTSKLRGVKGYGLESHHLRELSPCPTRGLDGSEASAELGALQNEGDGESVEAGDEGDDSKGVGAVHVLALQFRV